VPALLAVSSLLYRPLQPLDSGLIASPLLIGTAVAGPDLDSSAVGGASAGDIETEAGLATNDGAIGVEGPLLIGTSVAVPDFHTRARSGGVIGYVEALVAIDL
jgi:hypothetical protein